MESVPVSTSLPELLFKAKLMTVVVGHVLHYIQLEMHLGDKLQSVVEPSSDSSVGVCKAFLKIK